MLVTNENRMPFNTPIGRAYVWGLVNSETQGVGGWHFALAGASGLGSYYSENGYVFSRATAHTSNLLIGDRNRAPQL
jgi:hypothetical protein